MNFTKEEQEWLKRTKKERFQILIPHDMNARALSYSGMTMLPKFQIQKRVMEDFAGFFSLEKITPVENWDGRSDAFIEVQS